MDVISQMEIFIQLADNNVSIQLLMSATSKFKSTPTYSFKGRTNLTTKNNLPNAMPSPNQYNPEKSIKKSPDIKFPQSQRKEWSEIKYKQLAPGPGSHDLSSSFKMLPKKQKKTISRATRFLSNKSLAPAPNTYNNDSTILKAKGSAFTMQHKTKLIKDLINEKNMYKPGPGVYQQPIIKHSSTVSIKIGKSQRPQNRSPANSPGPGAYENMETFKNSVSSSKKSKFQKQIRKIQFSLGQRSPGPGVYERRSFLEDINKKQFSMKKKIQRKNPQESLPGPANYNVPLITKHKSSPCIKIGTQTRNSFTESRAKDNKFIPGPGSHEIEAIQKIKYRSMSVYRFKGKSETIKRNRSIQNVSVGPGHYQILKSPILKNRSQPKFSFDSKTKRGLFISKLETKPGPTEYDPKSLVTHKSQFTHKVPKSARPNFSKHLQKLPGPGSYQSPQLKRLGNQFKFSKEIRHNYLDQKIKKQKTAINQSYQLREQFPNPPKYHGVSPKIKFNEKKISQYK